MIKSLVPYLLVGVTHRDLKTSCILIDSLGRARVSDFALLAYTRSVLHHTSGCTSTVSYTAPEVNNFMRAIQLIDICFAFHL